MEMHGVQVEVLRAIDHDIATGVWPDMTEHGWPTDAWPAIYDKVIAGPIWLGDNSSVTKQVIERLYACSHLLNDAGQYAYYGRVGGYLITGNEDGVKHCAMNVLYSLQHLGYTIPPQADAGWIGEAGSGPSYLDPGSLPHPWMCGRGGRDLRGRLVQAGGRQQETVPAYAQRLDVLDRPVRAGQHETVADLGDLTAVRAGGERLADHAEPLPAR